MSMIRATSKILRTKPYGFPQENFLSMIKLKGLKMLGYYHISHWCLCHVRRQVSLCEGPKLILFARILIISQMSRDHLYMGTSLATFFCKVIVGHHSFPVETCTTEILPMCESQLHTLVQAFIEVPPTDDMGPTSSL